jgi:hypothetical protein
MLHLPYRHYLCLAPSGCRGPDIGLLACFHLSVVCSGCSSSGRSRSTTWRRAGAIMSGRRDGCRCGRSRHSRGYLRRLRGHHDRGCYRAELGVAATKCARISKWQSKTLRLELCRAIACAGRNVFEDVWDGVALPVRGWQLSKCVLDGNSAGNGPGCWVTQLSTLIYNDSNGMPQWRCRSFVV